VRYPWFRWLASSLALVIAVSSGARQALRAQDRAATPGVSQPASNRPTPSRHWWESAGPPSQGSIQPTAGHLAAPGAPGSATYRLRRDQAGDSKPLILAADEIATWTEKNGTAEYCVFLLRGLVLAQQGVVQTRFQQGVAWIDLSRHKVTGKLRMELYAEGQVRIDDGTAIHEYPKAVLDVTTRGEFRLHAVRSPLAKQCRADDPLVHRGRAEGLGPLALRAPSTAQAPAQPGLQRIGFEQRNLILPPFVGANPAPAPVPNVPPSVTPAPRPLPAMPAGRTTFPPASALPPAPLSPRSAADPYPGVVERVSFAAPPGSPFLVGSPDTPGQAAPAPGAIGPPPGQQGPVPIRPTAQPGNGPQPPGPDGPANGAPPRAPDGSVPPSGPTRVPPGTPPVPPPSRPQPPPPGRGITPSRNFMVAPRQGSSFNLKREVGPNGEAVFIITGGVILQVRNAPNIGMIDMEADRIVIWTRGNGDQLAANIQQPTGHNSNDLEVYLSGHVVVRQAPILNPKLEQRTISANEVYYDVTRNVAVALDARLELQQPLMKDPLIATAKELRQTSVNTFEIDKSDVFSSRLPSDPGLKSFMDNGHIVDGTVPQKNIFGQPVIDRKTGQPLTVRQTLLTGNNTFFELEDIPFFWLPRYTTTLQQPLGPLQDFNFGYNHLFGVQLGVTLNVDQLLGIQPRPNSRWLMNLDYLSYRGPGIGTTYDASGTELFGIPAKYTYQIRGFGMSDRNFDNLGGSRPVNDFNPTNFRGWSPNRLTIEDMPYGFSVLGQFIPISDRNFVEQYYQRVWDLDPNLDTFLFVKQQQNNWAWSVMAEPRLRRWVTMTQELPRADGWLIGQDFFQLMTYSTHLNAEYASLKDSTDPLPQVSVTDIATNTFRGSWMQEAQVPFYLGPLRLSPYGRSELTEYSSDLYGNTIGRAWGAAGIRGSIPFTHLYPSAQSELFNVNGLNHKIVLGANYVYAYTNQPYTRFPQLDRLNDDATNQMLRDIRPYQFLFNPTGVFDNHGLSLVGSPYYNTPQTYAIRRLLWDRIDTLSTVEELQMDIRQRWQTKRGFPGYQHIVDWMTLDTSATFFPAGNRDNFGHNWAFLEYNYLWNIGDRTAFNSTGWTDPFPGGVRVWTVGGYFNRPDRTNFYLGYRMIDPLHVRAVTGSVTYVFSPKYAATASSTYDFGTSEAVSNSVMFTRMGSDLQVSLGFSYNALQNNFGVLFNIVPNLLPSNRAMGPVGSSGTSSGVLK
jgi:hypothetical protein